MKNTDWRLLPLRENPALNEIAAAWFHEKWKVPLEAYLESIMEGQENPDRIPQWYLAVLGEDTIIGGLGVIDNDFHKRKDLTPNVCAVFVEEEYRNGGVARAMLDFVRGEAGKMGYRKLYLVTDHDQFYERCGWRFLHMVEEDGGQMTRMYEADTIEAAGTDSSATR